MPTSNGLNPAYPRPASEIASDTYPTEKIPIPAQGGLSKRELLAALALQGFIASSPAYDGDTADMLAKVAKLSVDAADALLDALLPQEAASLPLQHVGDSEYE